MVVHHITVWVLMILVVNTTTVLQSSALRVINSVSVDFEVTVLMNLLVDRYTPQCLRAVVGDGDLWRNNWEKPHVIINSDSSKAQKTVDFINRNTEKVTSYACVTYMMTKQPDPQLLAVMTDLSKKEMTRNFISQLPDVSQAEEFLLDERLRNEENVAALVKQELSDVTSWLVLTRQLLHPSGSPQVTWVNKWSHDEGLNNTDELFPEQMGNFYGMKLNGVTLDFRPFTDYEKIPGSRVVKPKPSLDVNILKTIAKNLNFTYNLVMPEDGLWGYLNDEGHWVGVVGDVEFRRANFSLVLSVTLERMLSVDFTRIYYRDPLSFVTAKSRPNPPWQALITPFSSQVWLMAVFTVLAAALLYYFIFKTQSTFGSFMLVPTRAFMHIFGSFLSQSLFVMPWFSAGQLFLGFWFLYALLITTYYKTSLMAALAVPFVPPPIDTLRQLMRSNLKYGMIDAKGSEYQLFSTSNVPLYKEMFKHMTFYSSAESMRLVSKGKYAYIYFKSNLDTIVRTQFTSLTGETSLHVASEEFFPGGYGWAFPKGVPYRRTFNNVMWRCVQGGLIQKWLNDLYSIYLRETMAMKTEVEVQKEKEAAMSKREDGLVVLSLDHLQGAFLFLFLGSTGGILLLILEYLAARLLHTGKARNASRSKVHYRQVRPRGKIILSNALVVSQARAAGHEESR